MVQAGAWYEQRPRGWSDSGRQGSVRRLLAGAELCFRWEWYSLPFSPCAPNNLCLLSLSLPSRALWEPSCGLPMALRSVVLDPSSLQRSNLRQCAEWGPWRGMDREPPNELLRPLRAERGEQEPTIIGRESCWGSQWAQPAVCLLGSERTNAPFQDIYQS